jgi:hypothetical protein
MDGETGIHQVAVDLSDNADAGFYAAGHDYFVELHNATIDSQTVNAWLGCFSIQNRYGSLLGPGGVSGTVTVTDQNTGLPLAGARVWVTTDAAGTNVVAGSLTTDSSGQVTFSLPAGTYYVWVQDAGYNGTNPTTWVVS